MCESSQLKERKQEEGIDRNEMAMFPASESWLQYVNFPIGSYA